MNRQILITVMALGLAGPAAAQPPAGMLVAAQDPAKIAAEQQAAAKREQQVVGEVRFRAAVEATITKSAPYSAEAITESVQVLPDGNRINRKLVTRVYRDAEGRTRREQVNDSGVVESISIVDPIAHTSLMLNPDTRTAFRQNVVMGMPLVAGGGRGGRGGGGGGGGRGGFVAATTVLTPGEKERAEVTAKAAAEAKERIGAAMVVSPEGPAPALKAAIERTNVGQAAREELGTQNIEGVPATGTRTTTTIPAGAIGNEQAIRIVSEQWFSPDLQLLVMTKHSDPRSGDTTYRLANIVRAEPDHSLFVLPPDYTLRESRIREPLIK